MAVAKNKIESTCKTKPSKDEKANLLKVLTATEMEIKYARHLADNDPKIRKSALKMLRRWFKKRGAIIDKDFSILWSGLYITFWMSDKPLVQEECAESIAALADVLDTKMALQFFESALSRLSAEWYGIDQLRMDKFLMLIRRLLRKSLQVLAVADYSSASLLQYQSIILNNLSTGPSVNNLALKLHLADIYLEEIAKTQTEDITPAVVTQLLQPFINTVCVAKDGRLLGEVAKSVFRQLMRQSDEGLDFTDKYKAWRQLGFRGGDISCMQINKEAIEAEDDEEDGYEQEEDAGERVLDPRAGRVNVDLQQIKFDAKQIADKLDNDKFEPAATSKNRKIVNKLVNEFRTLATGEFPLNKQKQTVELPRKDKGLVKRSANALINLDEKIRNDIEKNRKRRKENSLDADESSNKRLKQITEDDVESKINDVRNDSKMKRVNGAIKLSNNHLIDLLQNTKILKKTRKPKSREHLDIEAGNYEWKFKRPSGTWYVFKEPDSPTKVTSKKLGKDNYVDHDHAPQHFIIGDCTVPETPSRATDSRSEFTSEQAQGTVECTKGDVNSFTTPFSTVMKGQKSLENSNHNEAPKLNKIRTSQASVKLQLQPSTPKNKLLIDKSDEMKLSEKKVKIALNLNKSQEIHEHELQIKRSPAIPFDANRKPLKPLLKPQCGRFSMSPINPFAKSAKQRRSLMF